MWNIASVRRRALQSMLVAFLLLAPHHSARPEAPKIDFEQAVHQGRRLSAHEAQALEQRLERELGDLSARAQLLAYYFFRSSREQDPELAKAARQRHILWLIRNHPEAELAGMPVASIDRTGHALADAGAYEQARRLWIEAAGRPEASPAVLIHAARFFRLADKPLAETYLLRAREQRPGDPAPSGALGELYALAVLGATMTNHNGLISKVDPSEASSEFARSAAAALQSSDDAVVLGSAGYLLMFQGGVLSRLGQIDSDPSTLAQQCIAKAKQLDPRNPAYAETMASFYRNQAMMAPSAADKLEWNNKALIELEHAVDLTADPEDRLAMLTSLVRAAFDAGRLAKAETRAQELLVKAPAFPSSWNYGNAIHHGHLVIGRILLQRGEVEAAKARLLEAGATPGSPQLDSFGPNMSLAKELLERGEKESVLLYFERCASFWKMDRGRLDQWRAEVEAGRIPEFGANLLY